MLLSGTIENHSPPTYEYSINTWLHNYSIKMRAGNHKALIFCQFYSEFPSKETMMLVLEQVNKLSLVELVFIALIIRQDISHLVVIMTILINSLTELVTHLMKNIRGSKSSFINFLDISLSDSLQIILLDLISPLDNQSVRL